MKPSSENNNAEASEPLRSGGFFSILKNESFHFVIGFILVIIAFYLLMAMLSFLFAGGADQSVLESGEGKYQNFAGSNGAKIANFFVNESFGISSVLIGIFIGAVGVKLMHAKRIRLWKWFIICSVLLIWFSLFLGYAFKSCYENSFIYWGGTHGYNLGNWIEGQFGPMGVPLLLFVSGICLLVYISSKTVIWMRKAMTFGFVKKKNKEEKTNIGTTPEGFDASWTAKGKDESNSSKQPNSSDKGGSSVDVRVIPNNGEDNETELTKNDEEIVQEGVDLIIEHPNIDSHEDDKIEDNHDDAPKPDIEVVEPIMDEKYEGDENHPYNPRLDLEFYNFPTLDLLQDYKDDKPVIGESELKAKSDQITRALNSFGIEISSIKVCPGPTITLYEITPAEGVRISKIKNLQDDIAMNLAALSVRIIAPMPGRGTIGVEVPNEKPRIVPMRSILSSKEFQESNMELPIALGRTISNGIFMVDLAKAPHLLVAGATGQGKSVGLNAIITSLLYKKHPSELKFVIVDPKKVEFPVYAPIEKHFLAKLEGCKNAIITDAEDVIITLKSICAEMDNRYQLLQKAGCRNIKEYNKKFIDRQLNPENGHKYLPYIVVIIDEFSDLIMNGGKEVEFSICRIGQLARAAGIHAIIATQRPSAQVITGNIKTNFPARMAFRVSSMMDSRIILDRSGAQQLIGKGDMLYLQGIEPERVQCAFIDTPEVENIAAFIAKQQGYPTAFYLPEVDDSTGDDSMADVDLKNLDPMFDDAARLVVYSNQGSTSLIQRKFSIGYNRAGRIMDQLEKAGIVGPAQGSKPREVLCLDDIDLESRLKNLHNE